MTSDFEIVYKKDLGYKKYVLSDRRLISFTANSDLSIGSRYPTSHNHTGLGFSFSTCIGNMGNRGF